MTHVAEWAYEEFDEILKQPPLWDEFLRIIESAETDREHARAALVRHARARCPPPLVAMLAERGIVHFVQWEWIWSEDEGLAAQLNQVLAQNPGLWSECFRLFEMEGTEEWVCLPGLPVDLVHRIHNICPPHLLVALAERTINLLIAQDLVEKALEYDCATDAIDDAPQGRIN